MAALSAEGHFEPSLAAVFLPRCPSCGEKHPLAFRPPLVRDTCPACDGPVAPPARPIEVPAVITGRTPAALLARACFALARFFRRLAGVSA